MYLILLSLLHILEALTNLELSSREQQQEQDAGSERERLLPLTMTLLSTEASGSEI
jgi:hypothetical protein